MKQSAVKIQRSLVRLVESYPGLHLRELARQAKLSEPLASYHLNQLVQQRVIESREDRGFRRFYPLRHASPEGADRDLVSILRQEIPFHVALVLLDRERSTNAELTEELGLAKSTVSYHVTRMRKEGFLIDDHDTRAVRLAHPERVRKLLLRWEPPRSLSSSFSRIWRNFYRGARGK